MSLVFSYCVENVTSLINIEGVSKVNGNRGKLKSTQRYCKNNGRKNIFTKSIVNIK